MTALLRQMCDADLDMVLAWRNTPDVRRNMYTSHVISVDEHHAWWRQHSVNPATKLLICEIDSEPVGVVTFTNYTGEDGTAMWAFYSGNTTRRGIGRVMEMEALTYAFELLRLRRLEAEVLSFNRPVVDFHLRHGFTIEGVFRQAYKRDGELHDIYRIAMLADEWFRRVKPTLIGRELGNEKSLSGFTTSLKVQISPDLVDAYAQATGDDNPVHLDSNEAIRMGFPDRIAHGMLIGGFFSRCFANHFPGPGTIYVSQSLKFHLPVIVGSTVTANFRVLSHIKRRVVVETTVTDEEDTCVSGEAVLVLPNDFDYDSLR